MFRCQPRVCPTWPPRLRHRSLSGWIRPAPRSYSHLSVLRRLMNSILWADPLPALRAGLRPRRFENCLLHQVRLGHRRSLAWSGVSRSSRQTPRPSGCTSADSRWAKEGFGSMPRLRGRLDRTVGADPSATATSGLRHCSATRSSWSIGLRCRPPRTEYRSNSWNSATFGSCQTDWQSSAWANSLRTGFQMWRHGQRQHRPTGKWRVMKLSADIGRLWEASQSLSPWPRQLALQ